jgi:FHS family L-fucose permease-like MFS transporter
MLSQDRRAYPLASLGYGNWILRKYGYKATFMTGLTLYGIGAILMWPATHFRNFPAICCTTFIIGSGLGTLELAANPFMAGESALFNSPNSLTKP